VAILLIASIGLSCTVEFPLPEPEPEPEQFLCTIIRDDYGVPHVFADTKEGLGFGAGYAMAQDRLWQADVMRRAATGRLAEFGLATIQADIATRTLWYSQGELEQMYVNWDPGEGYEHLKPMIEAYVDGINAYIEEIAQNGYLMPLEYIAKGLQTELEPFTTADVVALTVLMGWRFGGTGGNEGKLYQALLDLQKLHGAAAGAAIWNDLFPLDDTGAPVTIPSESLTAFSTETALLDVPDNLGPVLEQANELWTTQDEAFKSLGVPTKFGSNAVLISPELSATGNALELGGPQMGYSMPQIVYELGLHGAGINAVGMAMPCAGPFILIGVSEYGAWTSTTGSSDVVDTRILTLNPANPTQYWHNGAWVNMERRNEIIYGPGKQTYQATSIYRSVYGPIVSPPDLTTMTAVTLQTPFFKNEIAGEQGWQLFQEATNIDEFEAAVELVIPNHNFYWADTEGNIGYWHAGRFPVKPAGADRRLPLKGDGTQEWVRVTSQYEIPRYVNPEQGWLANWNNKPIAGWQYAESDVHWGEGFRVEILMDAMTKFAASGDLTTDTLNTLNQIAGYHSTAGMNFAGDLIAAVTGYVSAHPDPELAAALPYLGAWATATPLPVSRVDFVSPKWPTDKNPTYDHPGLTIFDAWFDKIIAEVFGGILPADLQGQVKSYQSLLIRIFDGAKLNYNYLGTRDKNQLIVKALQDAIAGLKTKYGSSNMATWLTPVQMQSYDKGGALPGGKLHPYMNRGTYTQIVEMRGGGSLPNAMNVIPPGQSGFVAFPGIAGPHVADQVPLYASWTYKPIRFTRAAIESVETWRKDFPLE